MGSSRQAPPVAQHFPAPVDAELARPLTESQRAGMDRFLCEVARTRCMAFIFATLAVCGWLKNRRVR